MMDQATPGQPSRRSQITGELMFPADIIPDPETGEKFMPNGICVDKYTDNRKHAPGPEWYPARDAQLQSWFNPQELDEFRQQYPNPYAESAEYEHQTFDGANSGESGGINLVTSGQEPY
jgi:hypothetical protein